MSPHDHHCGHGHGDSHGQDRDRAAADPLARWLLGQPCPPWCDQAHAPQGHPYRPGQDAAGADDSHTESTDDDPTGGLFHRTHTRQQPLDLPATTDTALSLAQLDTTPDPDRPPTLHPASLWLDAPDGGLDLTATDARRLARALLDGADLLDPTSTATPGDHR